MPSSAIFSLYRHFIPAILGKLHHLPKGTTVRSVSFEMLRYLNQAEAVKLDEELFNVCHFGVEQLMELAGLSCASAIAEGFPESRKVMVVVGPGNNGGDGLVCARHLKLFGYFPEIFIPKRTAKTLYENLAKQCELFEIPFLTSCPTIEDLNKYSLVVDALFGFSYKPPLRQEYSDIIHNMIHMSTSCCSIDVPSGWDVENGPLDVVSYLKPEMLISLTAPKLCARFFKGKFHYLGGRFIAPMLAKKYELNLPNYPDTKCCVRLG